MYGVSVSLEGLAAITGGAIDEVREFLREWQNYALSYPDSERGAGDLWSVYGLLRGWLLSRLSDEERRKTHRAAGDFLREMVDKKRTSELGMKGVECLTEARAQYLDAGEYALAREATNRISVFLVRRGLYKDLESINRETLGYEEHPDPMTWLGHAYSHRGDYSAAREWYQRSLTAAGDNLPQEAAKALFGLATIDLNVGEYDAARDKFKEFLAIDEQIRGRDGEAATWHQLAIIDMKVGDYDAARDKFNKSLAIKQLIGNRADEAVTWHGLASIDLQVGDYDASRRKSEKILAIVQQIGDREGEAAMFHQLGIVAAKSGRLIGGARLVSLSFLITESIGSGM